MKRRWILSPEKLNWVDLNKAMTLSKPMEVAKICIVHGHTSEKNIYSKRINFSSFEAHGNYVEGIDEHL